MRALVVVDEELLGRDCWVDWARVRVEVVEADGWAEQIWLIGDMDVDVGTSSRFGAF